MSASTTSAARMSSRWQWWVRLLMRRVWFRAALFSLASVAFALLAALIAPYIPYDISAKIGADAVDNILTILATSMLAVTTFSLTAMVSVFAGASATITPRAAQLLVDDSTAQNALSTFIGAFLFSIVGICALSTDLYGRSGRVILFVGTLVVIVIIVLTLLRWIGHLSNFGRVGNTIDRVEHVAKAAIERTGYGISFTPTQRVKIANQRTIVSDTIGYLTHIDLHALETVAERLGCAIDVQVMPGAFITTKTEIAWLEVCDEEASKEILEAFSFDRHRQFDHDPRLGLIVLSEIASRALSPGVNDPGTAIEVLGAGVRVMAAFLDDEADKAEPSDRVRIPELYVGDLLDDLFRPILRDGAGLVEVAIKSQRSLAEIAAIAPRARDLLADQATDALARCEIATAFAPDVECVRAFHREHWGPAPA